MKKDTKQILKDYDEQKSILNDFSSNCKSLIIDLLSNDNIKYHQISDRLKERKKLEEKLLRKNNKYKALSDITDISGIRIITFFEDEIDKIAEIIEREFSIDKNNSIDKRKVENDKFGYRSLHYVVSLSDNRTKLTEYKRFKGLKLELQIRTILQHSWAEIEHDIGYKGEVTLPDSSKRTFHRVAALLEMADIEFVKLKNELAIYESKVGSEILKAPESVLLNKASLISYIQTSKSLSEIDKEISKHFKVPIEETYELFSNDILSKLIAVDVKTIKQLDDIITANKDEIVRNVKKEIPERPNLISIAKGIGLYNLSIKMFSK